MPGINEDDGDYATLRELPLPTSISQRLSNGDDTASEEGKVSKNYNRNTQGKHFYVR